MRTHAALTSSRKEHDSAQELSQLGARIPSPTHYRLRVAAATSGLKINEVVARAIERELDRLERELKTAGEGTR